MNVVDYCIISIIAFSIIFGFWRGFISELISLISWISAFIIAFFYTEETANFLKQYISIYPLRLATAFTSLFITILLLGGIIRTIISRLVNYTGLTGTDRILGIIFGMLRGTIIVTIIVIISSITPLPTTIVWQQSHLLVYFQDGISWAKNFLPFELAQKIKF